MLDFRRLGKRIEEEQGVAGGAVSIWGLITDGVGWSLWEWMKLP